STPKSAATSPTRSSRWVGECSASFPRLSRAATATLNSCSGPRVTERLTMARIGHRGDGVADTATGPLFVPYTLPGEDVTVQRVAGHGDRAALLTVERPSAERVEPICPHFGVCGGCATQHWTLPAQWAWKRSLVIEALAHEGLAAEVSPAL